MAAELGGIRSPPPDFPLSSRRWKVKRRALPLLVVESRGEAVCKRLEEGVETPTVPPRAGMAAGEGRLPGEAPTAPEDIHDPPDPRTPLLLPPPAGMNFVARRAPTPIAASNPRVPLQSRGVRVLFRVVVAVGDPEDPQARESSASRNGL